MPNDPLFKYIEKLRRDNCGHRLQFIAHLENQYKRVADGESSDGRANPTPSLSKDALRNPLKRVIFEIEALIHETLHNQAHDELCIWMLYVSRHKIQAVSDEGKGILLTPSAYRPWDGFDMLMDVDYVVNQAPLEPGQLRSWRCYSEFFKGNGSFVLQLNDKKPESWKFLRAGEEPVKFEYMDWVNQKGLYDAVGAFASSAWDKFIEKNKGEPSALYIIGVGSHDKTWPFDNDRLEAADEDESGGDNLNSVFLILSHPNKSTEILGKLGGLLRVIDESLKRSLLAERHGGAKREAERLNELTSILVGAEKNSERITLESLLKQAALKIKDCVKLCAGCDKPESECVKCNESEKVLWNKYEEAPAATSQIVEITWESLEKKQYDLTEEDKRVWGNKSYKFFFAGHASISSLSDTKNKDDHKAQTLRVVYVLMLRMRTRRAALRNALSAIMGRNMSHNIGSHVLARYCSAIKHDLEPANKENTDHRADFLSYLQRRMDFLAEVATSDRAHWAQPLSLKDALSKLNYKTQADRIAIAKECEEHCVRAPEAPCTLKCALLPPSPEGEKKNEPILLSYITGKESLKASVEFGATAWKPSNVGWKADYIVGGRVQSDYLFSCPGGEVGVQALYVILENIIRNSARHATGDSSDEFVRVFVSTEEFPVEKGGEELIKLTIIDPRAKLDLHGHEVKAAADAESPNVQIANGEAKTELCEFDAEGNRIEKESLTTKINRILQCEPFLNADGSTSPHFWGVREMQICAHYLRGYPLSDLESMEYDPAVIKAEVYPDPAVEFNSGLPGYCLSYEIYVQRAKLLAVVNFSGKADYEKNRLEQKGIKFIEVSGLCAKEEKTSQSDDSYSLDSLRELDNKVHGYGFVALPPDCKPDQRYGLPIRTLSLDEVALRSILDKACRNEEWIEPLHELVAQSYQKKSYPENDDAKKKKWGNGKIHAVVGWDGGEASNTTVRHSDLVTVHHTQCADFQQQYPNTFPFVKLPSELLVQEGNNQNLGLAWLDHPNDKSLMCGAAAKTKGAAFKLRGINWACVEPMFSDSPHTQLLKNLRDSTLKSGAAELVAAALARVVVLDERIQSRRMDTVRSVSLHVYWPLAGIWCPFHTKDKERAELGVMYHSESGCCDLDKPNFEDIHQFLTKPSKLEYQLPADYLVIHLTILENLNKQRNKEKDRVEDRESLNQTLCELIKDTACKDAEKIIVTGRGVPTAARHHTGEDQVDARFLPISALQEYLVTRPSKLALMRALWSASAPGHDLNDISGGLKT